jgi:aconitate hydratase
MLAAGLLARNAVKAGLKVKPWVKTSLAPGSQVVTEYLARASVLADLEALGFFVVGYGCTTCIGNSGPLPDPVAHAVEDNDLVVVSVLSGNRNFEGRINALVRANYLASPPLVVAYALAGSMNVDLEREPLGHGPAGDPVYLRDIWPSSAEVEAVSREVLSSELFRRKYADVFRGTADWIELPAPVGRRFAWDQSSTYVQRPTFLQGIARKPAAPSDVRGARVLLSLGDSVTTDHISPAGSIAKGSPAALFLEAQGVTAKDFNSYGARRGNHEVMVRGTFANVRIRNQLVPGIEGGVTRHLPSGEQLSVFDASLRYQREGVPLIVLAGKEYGTGSSRDWAAKGTFMLGVRAVLAQSFERIHRSNLIGMGVLPLQFQPGQGVAELGLTGEELFTISGIEEGLSPGKVLSISAVDAAHVEKRFLAVARVETNGELEYFEHGGILPYVLRQALT